MSYLQFSHCQTIQEQALYSQGSGRVYAMIFDPVTGNAVMTNGGPPYQLRPFVQAHQDEFAFILSEQRLYSWASHISGVNFQLPDTDYGEYYLIEYWSEAASGVQNRSADYFLNTEKLQWIGGVRVESRLSAAEDQSIADLASIASEEYECFITISYDSTIQRLGFTAWLEMNHQIQTNPQSAVVTIYDSTNNIIVNQPLATLYAAGQFDGQALNIPLSPDDTYFAVIKITDINGVVHTSGQGLVTWD